MSIIVFAGPSIYGTDIPPTPGLMICPPAKQGDIFHACMSRPSAIGLIDGYFDSVPSVWHKEILWAISKGIAVFGSASMGALRAAELDVFGMVGVGRIYQWYREGNLEDDDEVALLHGPPETKYLPLSEPMVNVRATCEAAILAGVLKRTAAEAIVASAKQVHYRDRAWDQLLAAAQEKYPAIGDLVQFIQWKTEGYVDQKRRDAVELIAAILRPLPEPKIGGQDGFRFEWTNLWDKAMQEWLANGIHADPHAAIPVDAVLNELRLDPELFQEICAEAVNRYILLAEAERRRLTADRKAKLKSLGQLREKLNLGRKSDLDAWARRNSLSEETLEVMVEENARVAAASYVPTSTLSRHVIAVLQSRDQYTPLAQRAAEKRSVLLEAKSHQHVSEPGEFSPPQLLNWFFGGRGNQTMPVDIDIALQNLRLESRRDFYRLLADEYIYVTSGKARFCKDG
jgi:hypothetical protein